MHWRDDGTSKQVIKRLTVNLFKVVGVVIEEVLSGHNSTLTRQFAANPEYLVMSFPVEMWRLPRAKSWSW